MSKTRNITGWVLSGLVALVLTASSMAKLVGAEEVVATMSSLGLEDKRVFIGIIELLCAILFLIPKTQNIGFFLVCSYLGGAIAAELVLGEVPVPGIVLSIFAYVGTMLRKPALSGLGI